MNFIIRNHARVPNKYIRYIKWKLRNIHQKFKSFIYSEIYISKEGRDHAMYQASVKLGIKGHDIILIERSADLKQLCSQLATKISRRIRKSKEKNKK